MSLEDPCYQWLLNACLNGTKAVNFIILNGDLNAGIETWDYLQVNSRCDSIFRLSKCWNFYDYFLGWCLLPSAIMEITYWQLLIFWGRPFQVRKEITALFVNQTCNFSPSHVPVILVYSWQPMLNFHSVVNVLIWFVIKRWAQARSNKILGREWSYLCWRFTKFCYHLQLIHFSFALIIAQ